MLACIEALEAARESGVCIDDAELIMQEYRSYLSPSGEPGVGDLFMQWLDQNQYNESVVERVGVKLDRESPGGLSGFPDREELNTFDPSDRKFVVVALKSPSRPAILNAVDSDWSEHREGLEAEGVAVRELCPQCLQGN